MQINKEYVDQINTSLNPQLGMSKPIPVLASNNKNYFLKRQYVVDQNGVPHNENAVFMQELFVSQIANSLRIPIPSCAILNLEKDFLEANEDLRFQYHLKPGLYFGSEILSNAESNIVPHYIEAIQHGKPQIIRSWNSFFRNVDNPEAYASIIALDLLTANCDRFGNEGNIIITNHNNSRKVFALDFGHCFLSPYWDKDKVRFMQSIPDKGQDPTDYINYFLRALLQASNRPLNPLGTIFSGMENNIFFESGNPFAKIVSKIESLKLEDLRMFITQIPSVWVSGDTIQLDTYVNFIEKSKNLVKYLLDKLYELGAFNNSLGGKLEWPTNGINYGIQ